MNQNHLPENDRLRLLTPDERALLETRGCDADCWDNVRITDATDLQRIRNVEFRGAVALHSLASGILRDCMLEDVETGDDITIRNVPGGVKGCRIADRAVIENTARISFEQEAACGVGVSVDVLDETGSRPVVIYPGLSAQTACLMARVPRWTSETLRLSLPDFLEKRHLPAEIGEEAVIRDCGELFNVHVGREVRIEGASRLRNGAVINNAAKGRALAYVGTGTDAENFIIEDGHVDAGVLLRNCYVGQGASLEKGFSAHDSLFFANCSMENGEACALFAGPYTVSMHKSTLLIGCQTSFMNAGSATNQSNHMYKLGPVHWGILERGVKTSSNSYLMLGADIGAFSLLMGDHKTHPDSTQFPFSYLFGDERGATVVVPGAMLRSCGLMRDEKKWPTRDRRLKRKLPFNDRITFEVLNPYTVDRMLEALSTIRELLTRQADDDRFVRYRGMKFSRASLERAERLYTLAIFRYLDERLPEGENRFPEADGEEADRWIDLSGQLITRTLLEHILLTDNLEETERMLDAAQEEYREEELRWIARRFDTGWREREGEIKAGAEEFEKMVETDRSEYLEQLNEENAMLSLQKS